MISQTVNTFKSKGWAQAGLVKGLETVTTYFIGGTAANGSGILALPNASFKNLKMLPAGAVENWNNDGT